MTSASTSTQTVSLTFDALGRVLGEAQPHGTVASAWDVAGRRTRLIYPDGYYVDYDHLITGEMTRIRENGATSGDGVLATFVYDDLGRRSALIRGNGAVTNYGYDAASRLASLSHDFAGTTYDFALTFGYSPAGQIVGNTRSNDLYSWNGHGSGSTASTANGLNRVVQAGSTAIGYDARGNIVSDGTQSYSYSSENRLTHVVNPTYSATINYDPLGRYIGFSPTTLTSRQDVSDGDQLIYLKKENAFLARTVFGPGIDEPLYQIDNLGRRTWFAADERGSIVAAVPADGNVSWTNRYDEYGNYASRAFGFGFAGAYWHTPTNLYYMRARWYHPKLGRFLQPDPIGYDDGMNMYAYVGGDPVNFVDPLGLNTWWGEAVVTGTRPKLNNSAALLGSGRSGQGPTMFFDGNGGGGGGGGDGGGTQKDNPCAPASVGEIKNELPSKGAIRQIKDGVKSYIQGVAWGGTALAAGAGLLGERAQQQARQTNARLGQVGDQMASHPGQTARAMGAAALKYPLQVGSRLASGTAVSIGYTPYVGVPVSALSMYGTAFKNANQHPDAVAAAVIVGEYCKK